MDSLNDSTISLPGFGSLAPDLWITANISSSFSDTNKSGVMCTDSCFPSWRHDQSKTNQSFVSRIKNGDIIFLCRRQKNIHHPLQIVTENDGHRNGNMVNSMWGSVLKRQRSLMIWRRICASQNSISDFSFIILEPATSSPISTTCIFNHWTVEDHNRQGFVFKPKTQSISREMSALLCALIGKLTSVCCI